MYELGYRDFSYINLLAIDISGQKFENCNFNHIGIGQDTNLQNTIFINCSFEGSFLRIPANNRSGCQVINCYPLPKFSSIEELDIISNLEFNPESYTIYSNYKYYQEIQVKNYTNIGIYKNWFMYQVNKFQLLLPNEIKEETIGSFIKKHTKSIQTNSVDISTKCLISFEDNLALKDCEIKY